MDNFSLKTVWNRITGVTGRRSKRLPRQHAWTQGSEHLEQRALLSASAIADIAPAEVSVAKAAATFPNLTGTWIVTGTGGTVATGNVVVTAAGENDLNATFNLEGLPTITANVERNKTRVKAEISALGQDEDVHLKGRFNRNSNELVLKGRVFVEGQGNVRVKLVLAFDSNTNPQNFSFTATSNKGGLITLQGSRLNSAL